MREVPGLAVIGYLWRAATGVVMRGKAPTRTISVLGDPRKPIGLSPGEHESMLTSRDRRRFERAAAHARRPSGRLSPAAIVARMGKQPFLVGLAFAGVAVAALGLYAGRSSEAPPQPEVALGGMPTLAPEPTRQTQAPPAADSRQASATDVRQVHLRELQPVLRTDAERLSQVARRTRAEGGVTDVRKERSDNAAELRSLFSPHRVLSGDLQNHYQDYSQAKERLRRSVAEQEEELQQTAALVMAKLALAPAGEPRRTEIAWAVIEKCLDRGPGMTLTTRADGYQYTVRGRTQRRSGATVAEDEGAAFAAFTSFAPESDVVGHCDSLKRRAAGIVATAEKLSADARVLAEQTTLPGECKYTKTD